MRVSRLGPVVLAFALVLGGLTACTGQGNAAARWLASHDVVESVDMSGVFSGISHSPRVEGVVKDSASAEEIRALALDVAAYLREHQKPGRLSMSLSQQGLKLMLSSNDDETLSAFENWDTLRAEARLRSGLVYYDEILLWSDRADLVRLAVDYGALSPSLTVSTDKGDSVASKVHSCGLDAEGALFASALLADPAVPAATVDLCSGVTLETSTPDDVLPLAARVRDLVAAAGREQLEVAVVYDSGNSAGTGWKIPVGRFDEGTQRLMERANAEHFIFSMLLDADGGLRIVLTGEAALREATEFLFSDPDITSVDHVALRASGYLYLEASSLEVAAPSLQLLERLAELDLVGYLTVTPTEITVTLPNESFTLANGRAAVDVISESELWRTRTVSIIDYSRVGMIIVEGVPEPAGNALGDQLNRYWLVTAPAR